MSGRQHGSEADRRVRKTRRALLDAFNGLFLDRRYDQIRVGDIVDGADVGRSTFYEHYRGKDDVLVQSMAHMLDVLASAASAECDGATLELLLRHCWENRDAGRYLLAGPPARHVLPRLTRELARRIEAHVDERARRVASTAARLPVKLVAMQAAEAQLALIRAWLAGEADCTPADLALGLRRGAAGAIAAQLAE